MLRARLRKIGEALSDEGTYNQSKLGIDRGRGLL